MGAPPKALGDALNCPTGVRCAGTPAEQCQGNGVRRRTHREDRAKDA